MYAPNTALVFYLFYTCALMLHGVCVDGAFPVLLPHSVFSDNPLVTWSQPQWNIYTPGRNKCDISVLFLLHLPPTLALPSDWARIFVCWEHFTADNNMVSQTQSAG